MRPKIESTVPRLKVVGRNPLWARLTAIDFFGNSFQLAALAILCFFPFLIVLTAAAGRSTAEVITGWLGLDQPASRAVADLFTAVPPAGSFTVASALLLILGAMAVAGTLQHWYQRVFDVRSRGMRDSPAQLCWLAGLLGYGASQAGLGHVSGAFGGPVLQIFSGLALATLFWWWTMRILLGKGIGWRALLPSALATSVCWVGLGVFSSHFFSDQIVANRASYGPIGVVMVIMSWLVAVGVVVHLGSVLGRLYTEHRARPTDQRH
ncbi:YhjD/YihY/BrkB family envelope integrity protein [Actinomadura violacea]|uniref:YihY/virulence factor BrkB family protein n=1 Tax=Actinomadura violacea TaxID=2819934 RepID=A0ABS3RLM6_9ACTN|nr:YhjD/YihY/BrkB family envelope integrity protein [Actinomadura violacea]MBO2457521.1 YihY/virulence factor BrkB family protein [Actinomadura violacea]